MQLKYHISDWLFSLADRNLKEGNTWSTKAANLVGTPAGDLCLFFSKYHLAAAKACMGLGTWLLT